MRLVLLGPPGSGKGTQGLRLAGSLGLPYLSTGDLLRDEVEHGTDLGRRVAEVIDRGDLVPDDLMIAVVLAALGGAADRGYVLDGFPRTVAQAETLERSGCPLPPPDVVVHLEVPEKSLRARLVHRAAVEDRADDADPEVIDRRMRVYQDETEPLVAHYRRLGVLVTVDGDAGPDEVARRIVAGVRAAHG
jgi:adenylate kinase